MGEDDGSSTVYAFDLDLYLYLDTTESIESIRAERALSCSATSFLLLFTIELPRILSKSAYIKSTSDVVSVMTLICSGDAVGVVDEFKMLLSTFSNSFRTSANAFEIRYNFSTGILSSSDAKNTDLFSSKSSAITIIASERLATTVRAIKE